jgi:hypothetical protein
MGELYIGSSRASLERGWAHLRGRGCPQLSGKRATGHSDDPTAALGDTLESNSPNIWSIRLQPRCRQRAGLREGRTTPHGHARGHDGAGDQRRRPSIMTGVYQRWCSSTLHIRWGLCDRVCQVLVCRGRYGLGGGGSSLHSGIEFGRSRTAEGSSGVRKKGVV